MVVVLEIALVVAHRLLAVMLGVVFAIVMEMAVCADCASRGRPLPVVEMALVVAQRFLAVVLCVVLAMVMEMAV
jgi:hypothetical protein